MQITCDTKMGDSSIICSGQESLMTYLNSGEMCEDQSIQEISSHLAYAEKLNSPDITVYQFLSGIASSTRSTMNPCGGMVTPQDITEIISEGDYLSVVDMMVHTFEVEHICSYVVSKFGCGV